MRTICLGGEERGVYITANSHCGKGSVVAVFIVADGRKCLNSMAFGQKKRQAISIKITYLLWWR